MTKFATATSALALSLILTACAGQEASDVAVSDDQSEDAANEEQYAAAEDVADAPYGSEAAVPLPDADDALGRGAVYADDPIASELSDAGLENMPDGPAEPLPAALIGEEEVVVQARDDFAMADADGDGSLSRDEYLATMAPAVELSDAPTTDAQGDQSATGGELAAAEVVSAADYLTAKFEIMAGPDEEVSLDELEDAAREDFAAADEDGDAVLTGEEATAFAALRTGQTPY